MSAIIPKEGEIEFSPPGEHSQSLGRFRVLIGRDGALRLMLVGPGSLIDFEKGVSKFKSPQELENFMASYQQRNQYTKLVVTKVQPWESLQSTRKKLCEMTSSSGIAPMETYITPPLMRPIDTHESSAEREVRGSIKRFTDNIKSIDKDLTSARADDPTRWNLKYGEFHAWFPMIAQFVKPPAEVVGLTPELAALLARLGQKIKDLIKK